MHFLTNTKAQLEVTFDAGDATGDVTVSVKNAAGTEISTGNATSDESLTGRYTYALDPQPNVASLTTTWSGTWDGAAQSFETSDEIVATQLFTLAELRDFDDKALADSNKWPDALLAAQRDQITDDFEQICNVSFIRRFRRDQLDGMLRRDLYLMERKPQKILAASVDGDPLDDDTIAGLTLYQSGKLYRSTLWPWNPLRPHNVVIDYEYGWQRVPAGIKRAALILARYELVTRDIGDRVVSVNTELGQVRLSVPGTNYPTGIPLVDAALSRYDETSQIEPF